MVTLASMTHSRLLEMLPLVLLLAVCLKADPDVLVEEEYIVQRINVEYEEITTCYINNSIEYVLVFPRSKVRDSFHFHSKH